MRSLCSGITLSGATNTCSISTILSPLPGIKEDLTSLCLLPTAPLNLIYSPFFKAPIIFGNCRSQALAEDIRKFSQRVTAVMNYREPLDTFMLDIIKNPTLFCTLVENETDLSPDGRNLLIKTINSHYRKISTTLTNDQKTSLFQFVCRYKYAAGEYRESLVQEGLSFVNPKNILSIYESIVEISRAPFRRFCLSLLFSLHHCLLPLLQQIGVNTSHPNSFTFHEYTDGPLLLSHRNLPEKLELIDIEKDTFIFCYDNRTMVLCRVNDGTLAIYNGTYVNHNVVRVDVGTPVKLCLPRITEYPEIKIAFDIPYEGASHDVYDFTEATGDMTRFLVLKKNGDRFQLATPGDIQIIATGETRTWNAIPKIQKCAVIKSEHNGHMSAKSGIRFVTHHIQIQGTNGQTTTIMVSEPDWTHSDNSYLMAHAQGERAYPLTLDLFLEALKGLPFQAITQPHLEAQNVLLLPKINRINNGICLANAGGTFFANNKPWDLQFIQSTIMHERMGHGTHNGNEQILFPLMVLFAQLTHQWPTTEYGKKNLCEAWAEAQAQLLTQSLPDDSPVLRLLLSVYTEDGSRSEGGYSMEDLGIKFSLREKEPIS